MHRAVDMHDDLVCMVKGVHSAQPCRVAGCPVNVEHEVESGEYKTHVIVIDEPARAQVCFVRREMILGCNCLERECECQSPQAGERIHRCDVTKMMSHGPGFVGDTSVSLSL